MSKVAIAQVGARRHYQVPNLLHQWGVLDTLYTDFYVGNSLITQLFKDKFSRKFYVPSLVKSAFERYDPDLDGAKVIHFPLLGYYNAKLRRSQTFNQNPSRIFVHTAKTFCKKILQHGIGDDTKVIYGFNGACLELFEFAKRNGIRCILDQTIAERFYLYSLLLEEEKKWPGWSAVPFKVTSFDIERAEREKHEQALADIIICGSDFVKASLTKNGVDKNKISVIPLGCATSNFPQINSYSSKPPIFLDDSGQNTSSSLKILFAGSVNLRKGIPYLLESLKYLKSNIPFVCKAAGSIDLKSDIIYKYSDICEFLGRVPRAEMKNLYQWADVLVLPSVCEGSAMVTYEALKFRLPVITTFNAGSVVEEGIHGHIIRSLNIDFLCEKIISLYRKKEAVGSIRLDDDTFLLKINQASKEKLRQTIFNQINENQYRSR